jgi:hypothetical protein
MDLTTVDEIKRAIEALTPEQLHELDVWFEEHYAAAVDAHLEAALDAGAFDDAVARAIADDEAGRTKPLEEVLSDAPPKE